MLTYMSTHMSTHMITYDPSHFPDIPFQNNQIMRGTTHTVIQHLLCSDCTLSPIYIEPIDDPVCSDNRFVTITDGLVQVEKPNFDRFHQSCLWNLK
jgi:hypothetical protein